MKWWRTEWKYWYSTSGIKLVSSPLPPPLACTTKIHLPGWKKNKHRLQFVLIVITSMRLIVLRLAGSSTAQSDGGKVKQLVMVWVLASRLLEILSRSLIVLCPVASETTGEIFVDVHRTQSPFLRGGSSSCGVSASGDQQRSEFGGLLRFVVSLISSVLSEDHPWLPQDDRLSYRESLRDSGVSRTWGRLGDSASSGRSLRSSSPASRLISGTLGVRFFPLRFIPVCAGTGKLPGSTIRLEDGPLDFMPWGGQSLG